MSQKINLDVTPGLFKQVLRVHQGDVGRQFEIAAVTRDGYEIPSGATFKIEATKPSGMGFSVTGTASGNVITFTTTTEMTDEAGNIPAQLRITSGDNVIFASNFLMSIEANAHPDTVVDGSIDQFIPEMTLLVERLEAAAETVEDAASLAPRISAAESEIDVLDARIDEIIAPSGSAPSEAEVTDARIGADGVTYSSLGTAIRTQVTDLKDDISGISHLNLFNGNTHNGIHSQTNGASYGTATAHASYFYTDLIPIDNMTSFYVFGSFVGTNTVYVTFFNSSNVVIGCQNSANPFVTSIPTGATKFIICMNVADVNNLVVSETIPTYPVTYTDYCVEAENKASIIRKRLDLGAVNAYVNNTNVGQNIYPLTTATNLYTSYPMDLSDVTDVSYRLIKANTVTVVYGGSSGKVVGYEVLSSRPTGTLTIPDGATFCVWYGSTGNSFVPEDDITFIAGSDAPSRMYGYDEYEIKEDIIDNEQSTPIRGKSLLFVGDSITAGTYFNGGWVTLIGNKYNCTCTNAGHDGWTIGILEDRTDNLLELLPTLGDDYDYVVLSGGYNDFTTYPRADIGSLTDYTTSTIDTSTFCGSLESYIRTAKSKWMGAKI